MIVVAAPSNLGLRPLRPGHEPGTWRAPAALFAAGLLEAVHALDPIVMARPPWRPGYEAGTKLRNGHAMRAFNLALADHVAAAGAAGEFAFVVGGDCSILLGALAGARRHGPLALVHVDDHSDFRHPGNYDPDSMPGAVAGMDLALATGRGEALMTEWPGVPAPLVEDRHVVQIGEREGRDPDFAWPDVNDTAIERIDVFAANALGPAGVLARTLDVLDAAPDRRFWIHLDVDVLDQGVMPAVDSPGSPGIAPDDLVAILAPLVPDPRCAGMTVTQFELGSGAKQFTALALLMLQRDGRLSLQDAVRKHLPSLPARYDGITLEQMMRHTSGIPDYMHLARIVQAPGTAEVTRASALALANAVPPVFVPNADFAYSNTAYLLLADVVEAVGGMPYAAFLDTRIFRPLGMTDTRALDPSRPSPARATLYDMDGDAARDGEWRGRDAPGAWGVRSTVRDLGRYNAALTAKTGLLAPYVAAMTAPGRLVTGEPVNYAAGLYVGSYRDVATVRHPGRTNVEFIRFPDSGRAVAIMCNRADVDAEMLAEQVADVFLAGALRPGGAELAAGRAGPLVPGAYVAPSGERMRIVEEGGKLALDGWGVLRAVGNGAWTAGPATDGLRVEPGGTAGHERLTIAFQSGLPIVFERYTAVTPAPDALRALTGTYHNDALRSVYAVTLDGGALTLSGPDRAAIPLEPMTPDLFAAGIWRVHVRRAPGGAVAAIDIGTARTPPIVYERVAASR